MQFPWGPEDRELYLGRPNSDIYVSVIIKVTQRKLVMVEHLQKVSPIFRQYSRSIFPADAAVARGTGCDAVMNSCGQ